MAKISTNLLTFTIVLALFLTTVSVPAMAQVPCSGPGEECGGFVGVECCDGTICPFLEGADYGYCPGQPGY